MSHLNEMKNFIKVVGSPIDEEDIFLDSIDEDFDMGAKILVEELEEAMFKLESYYSPDHGAEYNSGVQEGLNYAIGVLTRIIDSHKS